MYKLLLVTDRPEVRKNFTEFADWDKFGYREPRVAETPEEAEESLTRHHADAVALALPPEEGRRLVQKMNERERWKLKPIMQAEAEPEALTRRLKELTSLLNKLNSDYSNDPYNVAEMMQLARHDYFRRMISGCVDSPEEMINKLILLRSQMDLNQPCVVASLCTPEDKEMMDEQWGYGRDRLEVAMRNIFGPEFAGMRMLVSVQDNGQIYLVACPTINRETQCGQDIVPLVKNHVEESIAHVRDYLGITLHLSQFVRLNNVTELTGINRIIAKEG